MALRLSCASPRQARVVQLRAIEFSLPPGRALTLSRRHGAGEIHELKEELHSLDKHKQMDAVKKGAPPRSMHCPTGSQNRRLMGGRTTPVELTRLRLTGGTVWSTLSMGTLAGFHPIQLIASGARR